MRLISPHPWILVGTAAAAWAAVGVLALTIITERDAQVASVAEARNMSERSSAALKMHALVRDTEGSRAALESALRVDVLAAARIVEKAGADARVPVHIGSVSADSEHGSGLLPALFSVDASGSFSSLMHFVSLLETLPVPATLENVGVTTIGTTEGSTGVWQLSARIRVMTSPTATSL